VGALICMCTDGAFSNGLLPLARVSLKPVPAANDNNPWLQNRWGANRSKRVAGPLPRWPVRRAYGWPELILAVVTLAAGIVAAPLLQGLSQPVMTARGNEAGFLQSSPVAPTLPQSKSELNG
jgi:hypothetical protein